MNPLTRILPGALLGVACTLGALPAHAVLIVTEPWVLPAARGAATEAYMEITSSDGATLVEVRTPAAAAVQLVDAHGHAVPGPGVVLPAGDLVRLERGAGRIALRKLTQTLRLGDRVPMTLVLRSADAAPVVIDVDAEVRRRSPSEDHHVPGHTHAH